MALPQKTVFSLSTHDRYNAAVYFIDRNLELGLADKVAIRSDDGDVTYGDLYQLMNRVGNGLKALQVYMENRVALLLHDSVEFIASFFGTVKIGGIPIPVNTLLSPQDHVYILNDSRAKVAIIEAGLWQRLRDMGAALPFLKHVVVVCRTGETAPPESLDFSAWAAEQPPELAPADTVYDDAAFWLYTSGSTGKPKGVIHLQHDMEVALHNYAENILRMGADDVTFSASKLFFAYGMGNGMYFPLGVGGTTVLLRQPPTPQAVMETVQKYRPTLFFGVPTLYAAMLDYVEKTKRSFDFSSVRQGVSAGEPLPPAIFHRFREVFGVEILDGIGSTEALHIYISNRAGEVQPGSTGQLVPGYEARIVDEEGRPVPPGELGELMLSGDSLAAGYWNLHVQTCTKFHGAWLRTGDSYYRDENDFFWYCGRVDDMLKSGGIWVSPIEIENTLMEHEAVLEVAVIGVKDRNGLEKPWAFVVPKEQADAAELEAVLVRFVRERLAHYKCPKRFVFVEDLPKTATGKIQRYKLREGVHA